MTIVSTATGAQVTCARNHGEPELARRTRLFLLIIASCALWAFPAAAHVGFVKRQVELAGAIELTLRTPHGCNGSPTLRLRMRLPRAVTSARPQNKEGWTISQSGEGGAREVIWSGRLPDKQTGLFPLTIELDGSAKAGETLFFPVVQECETGVSRWIDTKGALDGEAQDGSHDEATSPAPSIRLLPRK